MKKTILSALFLSAVLGAQAQRADFTNVKDTPSKQAFSWTQLQNKPVAVKKSEKPVAKGQNKANYLLPEVVADGENTVYGFVPFDFERWPHTHSFVKFTTNHANQYDMKKIADFDPRKGYPEWPELCSQTFVGNDLYAYFKQPFDLGYFYPMGLYKMNIEDGTYEQAGGGKFDWYKDYNCPYLMDMSYDPTTGLIWGVAPYLQGSIRFWYYSDAPAWQLCYIDPTSANPYPTMIGDPLPECVANVVADHGVLHGVATEVYETGEVDAEGYPTYDVRSEYVKIVPDVAADNYSFEVIREYDADELYMSAPTDFSGLELDRDNRRLYMSYTSLIDGGAYFSELDLETGKVLSTQEQGGEGFLLNAIAIPYQGGIADDAPANVTKLTVTPGVNGAATANISWENPTGTYYDRSKEATIDGIRIYRDDKVVATLDAEETSYFDLDVPYGLYKYSVVPFNEAGEGLREARTAFVGRDLPGAPRNVVLTNDGTTATVTWEEPLTGAHGTWFDTESLTYDVVRMPDNITVATGLAQTYFTEEVTETKGYSYIVTSNNHEGKGESATSNLLSFGPGLSLPYIADFNEQETFDLWTVVDHNHDGFAWQWGFFTNSLAQQDYNCAFYDATFCGNTPSDYLISPVLNCVEGKDYKVDYEVMVHNYRDTSEEFGWYNGTEDALPGNGKFNLFEDGTYSSYESLRWHTRQGVFTADADRQRIAFSVLSRPLMGILYLGGVRVREYADYDLATTKVSGSDIGGVGREQIFTVKVKNEGTKTARDYKVTLFDQDGNTLTEMQGTEPIFSEETMDILVPWTPEKAGTYYVYARVDIEGDTYQYDNACKTPTEIKIDADLEGNFRSVGSFDATFGNWCGINYPYTQGQALYYGDELQLKAGDIITSIGFAYDGAPQFEGMTDINFEVSLGNTGLLQIYDYYKFMWDWDFRPTLLPDSYFPENVFFGFVDYNCTKGNGLLTFPFDTEFVYGGDNLLIKVVRTLSTTIVPEFTQFHMHVLDATDDASQDANGRAIYYCQSHEAAEGSTALGMGFNLIPVLYINYIDGADGIKGVRTIGGSLNVTSRQNELTLSETCTNVVVTDIQGRVIARANEANAIQLPAGTNGACIVTATLGNGETTTLKVALN